ncbi:MAG TPA: PDZ domain-containing protein [Solirubrobacteraceae bacterium]|nr:PDZ domain-containing protein [Solirubrobacteraceae bacterium]
MSRPRHLWSGDWELDSAAAREERDRRRAENDEPAPVGPQEPPPAARPSLAARILAALGSARSDLAARERLAAARARWGWDLKVSLVIALLILFTAGAAYGITALVVGSSAQGTAASSRVHAWLGIDVTGTPSGIMITRVAPGSPGRSAGLQPGDLLSRINGRPVGTVDGVSAALGGLRPGDQVAIQFSRGLVSFTALATLGTRRSSGP